MSMWNNAGRYRRDERVTVSSPACDSSRDEEDTVRDSCSGQEYAANDSSSDEEVNPPSTLNITRREQDFGIPSAYTRPQHFAHQPQIDPARDLIPVTNRTCIVAAHL